MRKIYLFSVTFLLLCISGKLLAQGQILTVAPNSAIAGQTDVVIRGMGTNFTQGQTTVRFGDGIKTLRVEVRDAELLTARVEILPAAPTGPHDVVVATNGVEVLFPSGFQVISAGGNFNATMIVVPIQSLKVSDFNPNNLNTSPVMFTVNLFNDQVTRKNVTVNLVIRAETLGRLGTGKKIIKTLNPGEFLSFDNRQFDSYAFENINSDIIQKSIQTGNLPADIYTYEIQITEGGQELISLDGSNTINNITNRPELIAPGNNFTFQAGNIFNRQPLFQWFAQATSFDFALYELKAGQAAPAEVVLNRPLYHQEGLSQTTMLYPASAQQLEPGKIYAWQIKANYASGRGTEVLPSEVFWFTITTSGSDALTGGTPVKGGVTTRQVAEIKILPEEVDITSGQSYRFTYKAYDVNMDTIPGIKPTYRVVPSSGGNIDNEGNFTASTGTTGPLAVVVTVGEMQDYATVQVTAANPVSQAGAGNEDIGKLIKGIFGLP